MNITKQPTPDLLRKILRYDPETGKLFWTERDVSFFRDTDGRTAQHACNNWNARHSGKEAFTSKTVAGYKQGDIFGSNNLAHRVIWAMQTGDWPTDTIDHKNLDKSDNRWRNLRQATQQENMRNLRAFKTNTSGYKGVHWDKARLKWAARIKVDKKQKFLGRFDDIREAALAYADASAKYHGTYGRIE